MLQKLYLNEFLQGRDGFRSKSSPDFRQNVVNKSRLPKLFLAQPAIPGTHGKAILFPHYGAADDFNGESNFFH